MTIAADTYAQLFDTVAQSNEVKQLSKVASSFFAHPATAYSLGALGLGLGLPVAYALGQRSKKEELDAERGRAFVAGLNTPVPADAYMGYAPEDIEEGVGESQDYLPDENAMNYYGMEPGVEDVYGDDYPDFGSYK